MWRRVIDANVLAKVFAEEEGTEQAIALTQGAELFAPDLIGPELVNVLWKKVRRGEMDGPAAKAAGAAFARMPLSIVPSRELSGAALSLSIMLDHPAYDCFYLALASAGRMSLVTEDQRLRSAIRSAGWEGARLLTLNEASSPT